MPQNKDRYRSDDGEHPFLTPKGLRLLRGEKRKSPAPMEFPEFPPVDDSAVDDSAVDDSATDGQRRGDRDFDPFEFPRPEQQPLFNIKTALKFPNPAELARRPLTDHFQSRLVANSRNGDLKAVGKLFIQVSNDPRYELSMGSAWITGPDTIATAAHNLFDSNKRTWSRALEFHPAYDFYADEPMPKCRVTSCLVPKRYFENPATNHDVAICYVDKKIGDLTGATIPMKSIVASDYFDHAKVAIVGYPAGSGFDFGKQMWKSIGDYLFGHSNGPGDDFAPVMATDFGGGASGCPWIVKDPETDRYQAVGVTSGHAKLRYLRGEPNLASLTSPLFSPRMFSNLQDNAVFHDFT